MIDEQDVFLTPPPISDTLREINLLREERDEARRLACELAVAYEAELFLPNGYAFIPKTELELAKVYGWDCYEGK